MSLFFSTRGDQKAVNAPEAVLQGLAPDGGLYTPDEFPTISLNELEGADFKTIAKRVLGAYLEGYTQQEIDTCVEQAYDCKFDDAEIAPVKKVGNAYVMELFHGPTAAFKDVALSILPRFMSCAMKKTGKKEDIVILTATSGDTGSAALMGFKDVDGIRIITFYPETGISPIQRAQMTTMDGGNVDVCAVSANFDAAQSGVKKIFSTISSEFCAEEQISLSSANSINFGRLAPQIVYYYSAYLKLVEEGEIKMGDELDFCVPTGNFGDILAGYFAKQSGLPIGKLICASNANNILTDFIKTGVYDKRDRAFSVTASPSMDILVSSNLERLLYFALGRDAAAVRERMLELAEKGVYSMPDSAMEQIRELFAAGCADDEKALDAIGRVFRDYGYLMDPHTAVAWRVMEDAAASEESKNPCVVLSTASAYKFPANVLKALGQQVPEEADAQIELLENVSGTKIPAALDGVLNRKVRFDSVIDPVNMMEYVMKRAKELKKQ